MKTLLPVALVLLTAAISGWQHGRLTERWGVTADVAAIAARIEDLAIDVDGWDSTGQTGSIKDAVRNQAGAEGYFSQHYVDSVTGADVRATVMCGPPGPIAMHVPTVCFTNAGMTQLATEEPAKLPGSKDEDQHFWMADYRPQESRPGPTIRAFWSWSPDAADWTIPEAPRFEFAREPYLYRIYITAPSAIFKRVSDDSGESDTKSAVELRFDDFVRQFLSRLAEAAQPDADDDNSNSESGDKSEKA
ncbi:MAG: hypothetical protein ABGZ35_13745 [Planctomycetaceae bacterium]